MTWVDLLLWEITNKNKENRKILSIRPIIMPPTVPGYNAHLMPYDLRLLKETEKKVKDGEKWAVITFKNYFIIKRLCKYEWTTDGYIFQMEHSTMKYVNDGQTLESDPSVKTDTDELINFLQDKNNHFVCKEGSKMTDIEIRLG